MSVVSLIAVVLTMLQAPAPLRTLDRGLDSQIDAARQVTARTAAEWQALWTQHAGERARPAVDFGKEMVAGVFLGSRPTAGFSVEIVDVREQGSTLTVQYRENRPSPGTLTAQVLTMPYHIVAVPKPMAGGDVRFEKIN
jgi:hypothetical protein